MASIFNAPVVNLKDAFGNSVIDAASRQHLQKVYSTLAMTLIAASCGAYVHLIYHLGGMLTSITCVLLLILIAVDRQGSNERRLLILAALGFFQGCSIGPLIQMALIVDPGLVLSALSGTATIFVCFSFLALMVERRHALLLGVVLSSAVSFLLLLQVFNMFFQLRIVHTANLYLGLAVFCGYVLYDTQVIIEKVAQGQRDYIYHALELFLDFVSIFVRVLIILLENSSGESKKKRETKPKDS